MTDKLTQWPLYPKVGAYKEACEIVLTLLGSGLCPSHEICEGCKYELEEAIDSVKAALGQPVPRQKCGVCGELDTIWGSGSPAEGPIHMSCHKCGTVDPPSEFVEVIMEERHEPTS